MSWVRLDDQHDIHRKVARLSDLAYRIWVSGMAWCHRQKTSGGIPSGDAELIVPGRKAKDIAKAVSELVSAGLWHVTETGHAYHDWQHYQAPIAATASERGKAGAAKRWGNSQEPLATIAKPVSHDGQGLANDAPVPIPIPIPIPPAIAVGSGSAAPASEQVQIPDPDKAQPISLKFTPHPSAVSELAAHYQVTEAEVLAEVSEFVSYWAVGKGRVTRKSSGGWQEQFRSRCRDIFEGRAQRSGRASVVVVGQNSEPKTIDQILAEQAEREKRTAVRGIS